MRHHGKIIEYVVRKKGYNIRDLAKALNISRRTLYNLFNQPILDFQVISQIGEIIRHDFSVEFPELFESI
jgi:lambda repressor-like predicted transcriptional regulator